MTIALSANTPRVSYTVSQGATQTAFTVNFEFFDDADLNFYVDGTLKTLTTHYTVSGGSGSTGTINTTAGNTVTGISGGSTVVITRDIALARTTDFPSSGAFEVATLNTELDRFTAIASDISDETTRSIQLADDDTAVSMVLPLKADRIGTVLGFNATTGAVEAGPTIANVNSLSAITANIVTVAGIASDIAAVENIKANVTTVAGIASNVTSVASLVTSDFISDLNAIEPIKANVTTVADNIAGVNSFASRYRVASSDPSSDNDAGDLVYNTNSNALKFYNGSSFQAISSVTTGISSGNVPVFTSGVADDDFLRIAGTTVEGLSASETATAIGAVSEANAIGLIIALS